MAKSRRPASDTAQPVRDTPASSDAAPGLDLGTGYGNAFAADVVLRQATAASAGSDPQGAFGQATSGQASGLPHRATMEAAFSTDLGHVEAHVGTPEAQSGLGDMNARGAASGDTVAFDSASPSRETVAHEVTHVLQGDAGVSPSAIGVAAPGSETERVADSVGKAVARGEQAPTELGPSAGLAFQTEGGSLGQAAGGDGASQGQAAGEEQTWEQTGNLIGNPPVREIRQPPNKNVVEDQAVYTERRGVASASLATQRTRADSLLDDDGNVKDFRFWFAKVYSFVTENELSFAAQRQFYYPSFVMASVAYFEKIYEDNFNAYDDGGPVEDHWREAFDECAEETADNEWSWYHIGPQALIKAAAIVEGAVSSLVKSMQAHIRFDLPRAEAWVYNQFYAQMDGVQMSDFRADFMAMSGVFDNAAARMNTIMGEKLPLPADWSPQTIQDLAMSYLYDADMATERADTWERAEEYQASSPEDQGPYTMGPGGVSGDTTQSDQLSGIGDIPTEDLRPSMDDSAESFDDDDVRSIVTRKAADGTLGQVSLITRVRYVRALMSGSSTNDDERAVLAVLDSVSSGETVTFVNACSAWDLMNALDWSDATALRSRLRERYYPRVQSNELLRLIYRCLDGETAEWEEEVVADLLTARGISEQITLIGRIGDHYGFDADDYDEYEDPSFAAGINKLEWQLDGADETRAVGHLEPVRK